MKYRAALIGCGNIGSAYADDPLIKGIYTHAGAYSTCESTQLIAVCDVSPAMAERCADRWNVAAVYRDARALIDEQRPEIVSICTPNHTHAEILEITLHAPSTRAVLMEKPLALDVRQAEALVVLAREKKIPIVMNYSRRYSRGHAEVRRYVESGGIGRIQAVVGNYTKGLLHNGTHWIDLARWMVGEISKVRGMHSRHECEGDAQVDAVLEFDTGATGYLHGLDAGAYSLFEMDLFGTKGRIRLSESGHRIEYFGVAASPYYSGYQTLQRTSDTEGDMQSTVYHALTDLVECLKFGKPPRCSARDGLLALQVATDALASARELRRP